MDEIREDLERRVHELVYGGFTPRGELVQMAVEFIQDEWEGDGLQELAEKLVADDLAAHAAEQVTWEGPTDCDRLDLAFAALERDGITARQDFTCCQSCGHAEIGEEMAEGARGYTFFHQQDTESAVEGRGVMLAYGATEPGEEACVAIGQAIVAALDHAGLEPDWNGSSDRRIFVPMDWRKRR